jgi:uncharacterized damage-inducible protein DinB
MNAIERARGLTSVLQLNDEVLMAALTDMTDDQARRRLREAGPSVAWNIGHMLQHRHQIGAALGCDGTGFDLTRYARSATDGADYPTVREFKSAWRDYSARMQSAVHQLDPDALAGPAPMRVPHAEQTLLAALRFVVWHEGLHLGQVSMLRSHHGLTPTVAVLGEQAAVA